MIIGILLLLLLGLFLLTSVRTKKEKLQAGQKTVEEDC